MSKAINYISEAEAMEILGLAKRTLRQNTMSSSEKRKRLPIRARKLNAKTVIYSKSDIDTYINSLFEKPLNKKTGIAIPAVETKPLKF